MLGLLATKNVDCCKCFINVCECGSQVITLIRQVEWSHIVAWPPAANCVAGLVSLTTRLPPQRWTVQCYDCRSNRIIKMPPEPT